MKFTVINKIVCGLIRRYSNYLPGFIGGNFRIHGWRFCPLYNTEQLCKDNTGYTFQFSLLNWFWFKRA